jgi:hypothetical protein
LLHPDTAAAGEHPRRPRRPIIARSANDGGVAVGGQGDRCTLGPQSSPVFVGGTDQLSSLLPPATTAARDIHAAPAGPTKGDRSRSALFGPGPPTMAVLPSADSATDMPWLVLPTAPVPTSFGHCWKVCIGATCSRVAASRVAALCRRRSASGAARPFRSTEKPACDAKYRS